MHSENSPSQQISSNISLWVRDHECIISDTRISMKINQLIKLVSYVVAVLAHHIKLGLYHTLQLGLYRERAGWRVTGNK